ncbi:hypothetical protein EP21_12255 [Escherichia coli]|nr:hypothetical protein EP21_12255 [Escherichia coli]
MHDKGDVCSAGESAVDFSLDVTTLRDSAVLFAVCHGVASLVVSFENSPSRAAKLWVARRTGFAVPATKEPGPTEVGPVRPAIILTRKKRGNTVRTKKPLARLCALVVSRLRNPAPVL